LSTYNTVLHVMSASHERLEDIMRRRRAAVDEHDNEYTNQDQDDIVYCKSAAYQHSHSSSDPSSASNQNPWNNVLGKHKESKYSSPSSTNKTNAASQHKTFSVRDLASSFAKKSEADQADKGTSRAAAVGGKETASNEEGGGEIAALLAARRRKVDAACNVEDFVGEVRVCVCVCV
jgi:superfamily II DNA helicase RecQ